MSSPEERERRVMRRINHIAKDMRTGDNKGAFKLQVVPPKTEVYKRKKIKIKDIERIIDSETDCI